ncbi:MAG: hypothetical protein GX102_13685 [Porphyromonadaceae bacterium]|nr:hypothetical protein [Porphyromonadaceae bacterium]
MSVIQKIKVSEIATQQTTYDPNALAHVVSEGVSKKMKLGVIEIKDATASVNELGETILIITY